MRSDSVITGPVSALELDAISLVVQRQHQVLPAPCAYHSISDGRDLLFWMRELGNP